MEYLHLCGLMLMIFGCWETLFTLKVKGQQVTLRYRIEEEIDSGTVIGNLYDDAYLGQKYNRSEVFFVFISHHQTFPLDLDQYSGEIRTSGRLDRDVLCPGEMECWRTVDVLVQPSFDLIKVSIQVKDLNDNSPVFPKLLHIGQIQESANPGSSVVLPPAMDPDSGVYGIQGYELVPPSDVFEIREKVKAGGSKDIRLILVGKLDREVESYYRLQVVAYDGGSPPKSGSMSVTILVLDANDNDPVFEQDSYEATIPENSPLGITIVQVHASDRDIGDYGEVMYKFSDHTWNTFGDLFGIVNTTGEIFITGVIDYEQRNVYELSVLAYDLGPDSVPSDTTVIVHVVDVNDNSPSITVEALNPRNAKTAILSEDVKLGTFVALIAVEDSDVGVNGQFRCSLNETVFEIQSLGVNQFTIKTRGRLDREDQSFYKLAFICTDNGTEPRVSVIYIPVLVTDVNDNAPVFVQEEFSAYVSENNFVGVHIIDVNATDDDAGVNAELEYMLDPNAEDMFSINSTTGSITAQTVFDREQTSEVRFQVLAVDGGDPPMTGTATVIVYVTDINDERPKFLQPAYSFSVCENQPNNTIVGMVAATDADAKPYNEFVYTLLSNNPEVEKFAIEPQTGQINTLVSLDREDIAVYYLTVVATDIDIAIMSSTASVTIYVNDSNDNLPVIDYPSVTNNTVHVSSKIPVGHFIVQIRAHDLDLGSNANLTYELVGDEENIFIIDLLTGHLYLNQRFDKVEREIFELQVKVQDREEPVNYTIADLIVVVNHSLEYYGVQSSEENLFVGHNLIIVVTIVCVTAAIIVFLVIAIIRTREDGQNHKYNCRTEALKRSTRKGRKDSESHHPLTNNNNILRPKPSCFLTRRADRQQKGVSFSLERDGGTFSGVHDGDSGRSSWPLTIDNRMYQILQAGGSYNPHQMNNCVAPPGDDGESDEVTVTKAPWTLSPKELALHQLYHLKNELDADSAYSADNGSNADSGHGPSEEGEAHPPGQPGPQGIAGCSMHYPNQILDLHSTEADDDPQNGTTSGAYSPPVHSYSSHPVHPLHTFSPRTDPECVVHTGFTDLSDYVTFQRQRPQLHIQIPDPDPEPSLNSSTEDYSYPDHWLQTPSGGHYGNSTPYPTIPRHYDRQKEDYSDFPTTV